MIIKPLASSSEGNAYLISDEESTLLVECGIPFSELQKLSGFTISKCCGCLVSHSHNDHSIAVNDVLKSGIDTYMSARTLQEKVQASGGIASKHRLHIIESEQEYTIGTFNVIPLAMNHDVYCLGFLIYSTVTHEKLLFATDTFYIQWKVPGLDYIMIEANYDIDILNQRIADGDNNMASKDRLMRSHMEIQNTIRWLENSDLSKVKRIYLMHLSGGSANAREFKKRVMEATGKPVTVCCHTV